MQKKYVTYKENKQIWINILILKSLIEKKAKTDSNALSEVHGPDTLSTGLGRYWKLVDTNFLRKHCEL